jgi:hypothetical protein
MVDFNNKYLTDIEKFLEEAIEQSEVLGADDIDPREITYEMVEQLKQNCYAYEDAHCVPNIVTISIPETKADKAEDFETVFNTHTFLELFEGFLADLHLRLFNPLCIEVQTVSKGNSRVMYGRAGLALDWPGPELASEFARVELDYRTKRIVGVMPPRPQISQLARLTALNAEVYQNRYLITKAYVQVGRLRSVIDEDTGKLLRRNDFVFAHQEPPSSIPNSVSRQHATIAYRVGTFYLIDHGSANGTAIKRRGLLNSLQVTAESSQGIALEDGDTLRFGSALVNFELVPVSAADSQFHYELPRPINPHPGTPKNTDQFNKLNPRFDTNRRN